MDGQSLCMGTTSTTHDEHFLSKNLGQFFSADEQYIDIANRLILEEMDKLHMSEDTDTNKHHSNKYISLEKFQENIVFEKQLFSVLVCFFVFTSIYLWRPQSTWSRMIIYSQTKY